MAGSICISDTRIKSITAEVTTISLVLVYLSGMGTKRPKIVEKKNRIGDFEIDTVIRRQHIGALVTVVDRKSKFTLIKKVESKQSKEVTKALITAKAHY